MTCFSYQGRGEAPDSLPGKAQVSGSLEGEQPPVSLCQHSVFRRVHGQLHPVPAGHLESDVIAGGGGDTAAVANGIVAMVDAVPLGDHGGLHRQPGGVVVPVPLPEALDDEENHHAQNQKKDDKKEKLKSKNDILRQKNENLKNKNEQLKKENKLLKAKYDEIINSNSWKITEPLRKFKKNK